MIKNVLQAKQTSSQNFTFTQQLAKNISLLAHPIIQIRQDVLEELQKNPALEIKEEPDHESLDELYYQKDNGADAQKKFNFVESLLVSPKTLRDYLIYQLHLELDDEKKIEIGTKIINNLNEHGFYQDNPFHLCKDIPNIKKEYIQEVLNTLQILDPVGCATSGIIESLRVQIAHITNQNNTNENAHKKILECITILENAIKKTTNHINNTPKIEPKIKPEIEPEIKPEIEPKIQQTLAPYLRNTQLQEILHSITPYPGLTYNSNYDTHQENYIIPDAFIEIINTQSVKVTVNNTIIPVVAISKEMQKSAKSNDKQTALFASNFIQSAQSFITGLQYRTSTLEKVIGFIAHYHIDFFLQNTEYPLPLTRVHIAKELKLNESTISRIISGKYIQTPHGIIKIQQLLSHKIGSANTSVERIKKEIQNIIKNNTEKNISDNEISQLLAEKGISIARRTVAKYRQKQT